MGSRCNYRVSSSSEQVRTRYNFIGSSSPMIGGFFLKPAERFPKLFGTSVFLQKFPYFLPCAVPVILAIVAGIVAFLYLKEVKLDGFPSRY
jgi:hypothetical protein